MPDRGRTARAAWPLAAAAAVLAGALWLRAPGVPYLAACAAATAATLALVPAARRADRRGAGWRLAFAAAAALFCLVAARAERALWRVEHDWPRFSARITDAAARALRAELDATADALRSAAERAVAAPDEPGDAFRALEPLAGGTAERGVVLWRGGRPAAWAGTVRVVPDSTGHPYSATLTSFYVALHATARREGRTATATALVHAEPPADRLSAPLDARVAASTRLAGFAFDAPGAEAGGFAFAPGGAPLFSVRPLAPARAEVRLLELERARARGALLLAVALVCFLAVAWPRPASSPARLASLLVPLAAVVIVPLNAFSNRVRLFDPSFYFAPLGGPFTSSVGALALTSGIVLLGLLAVLRSRARLPSRWLALAIVLAVAGTGPFVLRKLAAGISPPAWGVPTSLWLAWEIAIFLAATSVLVAGASAGRVALGGRRGLPPAAAPALAGAAALLAPIAWAAPGSWPEWYPLLWIAAIGALALTRASRALLLAAAVVAGFGAATLVWGATSRKRVELAERDVAGLSVIEPEAAVLADRFAAELQGAERPRSRAELLRRFVGSELAAAGYPVGLASWASDAALDAELAVSPVDARRDVLESLVREALGRGRIVMDTTLASPGVQLLLAVPHADGGATTAIIAPRTRLLPDDPFAALLGVAPSTATEPPYSLTPVEAGAEAPVAPGRRWSREGNEMHGNWTVPSAGGARRVHVEVELRELDALVQRGALVMLLDVAIVGALWLLVVLADGGIGRWGRARHRGWARSFRARLTFALFGFFVVPAVAFAVWSYRRLQTDDLQSRELLVREALRTVAAGQDVERLVGAGSRLEMPLLLFADGALRASSDTLYEALAPIGRFVRPEVHRRVVLGDEIATRSIERVGETRALFGYRVASDAEGRRVVLAAPARTNELVLDRRRRDLGVLVAFATVLGGIAALWLSGVAARQLALPIAVLRRAALAIAAGEREPALPGEPPPAEFVPVFNAFRRMAADLDASRTALEEAQRRTAAVLRNVASGVVAVDPDGTVLLANPQADLLLGQPLPPGARLAGGAAELAARVAAFARGGADDEEFDLELHERQLHARLTRLSRGAGGVVLTLDDVTELARAQRVLAWGEMARQVAHEIKNPLTPIRLGVQHLRRAHADRRGDFDRILEQNVARILGEIDRLDEIARAFSRYGTAPEERTPARPVDVAAVVRDVVELERMGAGGVEWQVDAPADGAWALAGAEELREVLLNLLENARLAGARAVRARVRRDDGTVAVAVADDGEGIPGDVLPRIFEPHFSTRTSGSGLGLAISRRLVDGWGGSITAESERGRGTTVTVRLRATEPAA